MGEQAVIVIGFSIAGAAFVWFFWALLKSTQPCEKIAMPQRIVIRESERVFNDLPPLGQQRALKNQRTIKRLGVVALIPIALGISLYLFMTTPPVGLVTLVLISYYVIRSLISYTKETANEPTGNDNP